MRGGVPSEVRFDKPSAIHRENFINTFCRLRSRLAPRRSRQSITLQTWTCLIDLKILVNAKCIIRRVSHVTDGDIDKELPLKYIQDIY